ncbi:hypothetical protein, variant 1 [Aphanomyces astaci]|uniref:Kinesin motor domain-containing protein n=1 Tax=Aphanomyces astaci TaxID=112090 RepID=W4G2V7_APHAT|nr:hypothetical protein, variant 1 [Aphanomyces astaci]ETV73389.1 hypothetical protein, variant 1 [Aphanomyces astaci]|eukprot:XP_009837263.1 hypothetical protein, variant 1 [Aphanomyces astaci]
MATLGKAAVPQRAKIGVRIRPLLPDEEGAQHDKHAWTWHNRTISQQIFPAHRGSSSTEAAALDRRMKDSPTAYTFDRLFPPETSTAVVYGSVAKDAVMDAMRGGHNALVVAYGQTNSGKTYSIQGKGGIIGLALRDIFQHVQEQRNTTEYLIRVAFVDIDNECFQDLLTTSPSTEPIRMVQGARGEFELTGHTEVSVMSLGHALAILDAGIAKPGRGAAMSQRHTILRVTVEYQAKVTTLTLPSANTNPVHMAVLHFVDLAPSESVNRVVQGRDVAGGMNKSLLAFGHILWKLSHEAHKPTTPPQTTDLPYGDSQLTRMLQPSLGPHASLVMLCTLSPSLSGLNETHKTLKFASRAKRIHYTLRPRPDAVMDESSPHLASSDSTTYAILALRRQLASLHAQLSDTVDDDSRDSIRVALHNVHRVLLNSDDGVDMVSNDAPLTPKSSDGRVGASDGSGDGRPSAPSSHRTRTSSSSHWNDDSMSVASAGEFFLDDSPTVHAATLEILRHKIDSLRLNADDAAVLLHGLLVLERAYNNATATLSATL